MYSDKHRGEYREYRYFVNIFIGYHSNGRESVKSEEVMGEET